MNMLPDKKILKIRYNELRKPQKEGNYERLRFIKDALQDSTFLPKTLDYEDIDKAFKEWVESLKIYTNETEKKEFPTYVLFSNQRFSEYTQSWQYTDANKNLILNFKTITRENNPQYGRIQDGMWNIPGEQWFLLKRETVLDDNDTESFLDLSMKMPTAVDLNFKVSIFTDKYIHLNEFNTLINREFNSRQVYISPNGHDIPMVIDGISDESSYNIDDRQFYCQSFNIKVMGYIITKDDYRITHAPKKMSLSPFVFSSNGSMTVNEIIDEQDIDNVKITYEVIFDGRGGGRGCFVMPRDLMVNSIELDNVYRNTAYEIWLNGEKVDIVEKFLKKDDKLRIKVRSTDVDKITTIKIIGN